MGGHIPVKNKRARETEVSRARFIFSGENILPLYQGTGEGLRVPAATGGGPTRCTMQKAAGIDSRDEGIPSKNITLRGQKSR